VEHAQLFIHTGQQAEFAEIQPAGKSRS